MPQIEVSFDIDANGIVNVGAKDLGTGKEQKITITGSSGLDKDEVEKMVSDASQHAEEDRQAREAADARNKADQMVYQVEKTLKENEEKFSPEERQAGRRGPEGGPSTALEQAPTPRRSRRPPRIWRRPRTNWRRLIYKANAESGAPTPAGDQGGQGASPGRRRSSGRRRDRRRGWTASEKKTLRLVLGGNGPHAHVGACATGRNWMSSLGDLDPLMRSC